MHYGSVIVWCVLALSSQLSASMDCASEYVYDRQPPVIIVCNPYINQALLLDCSITGQWPVQLQWYFSPAQSPLSSILITNSSQYQLDDMSIQNTTMRIGLRVRGLSAASENVTTGYYWCQGSVPGGILTPSGKVILQSAEYYRYVTAGCNPKVYLRSSDQACPVLLSQPALSTAPGPSQVMTTVPMATQSNPTPIQPVPPVSQTTPSSGVSLQQPAGMYCASEYVYDRQPPVIILCNPYINQALLLDCSITGPWPVQLQWYFSPAQSPLSSVLITNSSQYQLDDMSIQNTTTRIGLTVRGLSAASENVTTGYYWCQGSVPGGILTPSGKVTLQSAEYYRYVTIGCNPKVYLRSADEACPV